ncbi:MAG: MBL fold metallo-hydrolase [Chloroflexi bacterium]|nr:MBL fold metallo-hydrolase [Chloroflexota bacterium]
MQTSPLGLSGEAFAEVAEKTWCVSILANVTAFETDEGLVLVDAGLRNFAPRMAELLRQRTKAPVHTAIYTHGHVDHAFGLDAFLVKGQRRPRVIGHSALPARLKRYERTPRFQKDINARQFYGSPYELLPANAQAEVDTAFRTPEWQPDVLYDDRLSIEVGGLTFELHHARGETDDHTWVFCPQRGVLCTGDLVIWVVPNGGNPQKVQRYPWEWAQALRRMAELHASSLCPGHGPPVSGDAELVQRILLETAAYLDSIVGQTLAALENGAPPHVDIVRSVRIPSTDAPWLLPLYDEAEFIARNVIRYYGGWYSGRPSELKPASRADVAREIARLSGGAEVLAKRARAIAETGDLRLACHLADYALEAAPGNSRVNGIVARIYEQRAASETSLMAIDLFRSAAAYARAGRAFI